MEFNEKLQELRKQKNLTQEELAQALFVSRTAISKWESGRGYPNIDSLKAIAKYFHISIDQLLSGDELLCLAEENTKQKQAQFRDLIFGLLDCSMVLFFLLPLFGQKAGDVVQSVSLLALHDVSAWLKALYLALVIGVTVWGIAMLALQNFQHSFWQTNKSRISLSLNILAAFVFIVSLQPYTAVLVFVFLMIKVFLLIKKP